MSKQTLYDLDHKWLRLQEDLETNGGEITPEMERDYEDLLTMTSDKLRGYVAVIRKLKAEAKANKAHANAIKEAMVSWHEAKAKSQEASAKRLLARICDAMVLREEDVFECDLGKIRIQTGPETVVLTTDLEELPEHMVTISRKYDSALYKSKLKAEDPEFLEHAKLEPGKTYAKLY